MLWEGLHNCSCGDYKIIPQCEPNPEKEKSYSKFQAFPPAEMEAGRRTLEGAIGRGRGLVCVRSGKVIEEFINSRRALKQLHLRLRWGKMYHKPNHWSSFQQRRRLLSILWLVLLCFEDWCQNKSNEILMVFSFLICQLKSNFWEGRILHVLQMSFIQNLLAVTSENCFS